MKIIFEDIKIFAHHGWYADEQLAGHWFSVDVQLELKDKNNLADDLANTFNYELVYQIVQYEMAITQKLLETVVSNILNKIMQHQAIASATVRVNKLNPFKMEGAGRVAIELNLTR
jgi:dihydroneopterin aldolase